jgi:uncharacterized protein YraI
MKVKVKLLSAILLLSISMVMPFFGSRVQASGAQQQAQFAIPLMVVNTSFLNIRTGPGVQYTILVTVVGGTELPVLGVADDRVWYYVSTPVGNGWVNIDFVLPRGDFRNVPLIDPVIVAPPLVLPNTPVTIGLPAIIIDNGQGGGGVAPSPFAANVSTVERFRAMINVEAVDVRTAPEQNAPSIATLLRDDTQDYAIVGRTTDRNGVSWLAIAVPNVGSGWIEEPKVFFRLSARYRTVLTVIAQTIQVTNSPGGNGTGLPQLPHGSELFLLDLSRDSLFVKVETTEGEVGWVPFSAVVTRTGTTSDEFAGQGGGAQAQSGGGQAGAGQGGGGVVGGVIVQPGQPALALPHVVVNTGNLNIRSGPGAQFTSVAVVPGGTELGVIGVARDGVWYLVLGSFGQGWINIDFVLPRGDFRNVPLITNDVALGNATVASPTALVTGTVAVYTAPATNFGQIGVLYGPVEVNVVARTADFSWVQVNTSFGYGWVQASQVAVRGEVSVIPIV